MELRITNQRLMLGLGLGLITLLTFGCSTTPIKWYKPGVSQATFSRDKAECEDALLSTGTTQQLKDVYSYNNQSPLSRFKNQGKKPQNTFRRKLHPREFFFPN
jgi:hypothetical protein